MAQPPPPNRPRAGSRLASLARLASHGQGHPQRNSVPHHDRSASAGLPTDSARGPPPGFAAALRTRLKTVAAEVTRLTSLPEGGVFPKRFEPRHLGCYRPLVPRTGDWRGTRLRVP